MGNYVDGINFVTEECCNCGIAFAMTSDFVRRRSDDHKWFYCPAGHGQHYTGKSKEQKLQDEVDRLKMNSEFQSRKVVNLETQVDQQQRKTAAYKGQVTKLKNRAAAGVCPCCSRHFENLHRHMDSKHPNFIDEDELRVALKQIRESEGLSQLSVAEQAGVRSSSYVSMFENNKPLPAEAKQALLKWTEDRQVLV